MELLRYLLLSTICLSLSYIAFCIIFSSETGFHKQRLFIIASIVISLLLPQIGIRIDLPEFSGGSGNLQPGVQNLIAPVGPSPATANESGIVVPYSSHFVRVYLFITVIFAAVLAFQLLRILHLCRISRKRRRGRIVELTHPNIRSPFSFFHLVFIPENIDDEEKENILIHEGIHASQYHTLDNLLIELTAAVMWFNPFVWMMKRSLKLVHEYLADEGTLSTGIDTIRYQALLVNQVAEERLISLSSGFNKALIKKRMIMMTKSKKQDGRFRILAIIPLSAIMLVTVAFLNGFFPKETKAVSSPGFTVTRPALLSDNGTGVQQDTVRLRDAKRKDEVRLRESRLKDETDSDQEQDIDNDKKVKVRVVGKDEKNDLRSVRVIGYGGSEVPDSIIYVVDGVHVKVISDIDPESIESVNVLRDDNLIVIRTKKKTDKKVVEESSAVRVKGVGDDIIYVIDGNPTGKSVFELLEPADIESISVLKGGYSGIKKYTDRTDIDGIIIVTTKK